MTESYERSSGLRVLSVTPGDGGGSSMVFCRRLDEAISRLGVRVQSYFFQSRGSLGGLLGERRRLRAVIDEFEPDVVHAQYGTITSIFCALSTARPLVITFRGSDLNPAPSINVAVARTKNLVSQISALRADAVICVSEELRRRLLIKRSHVYVLPSGVDTTEFYPRSRAQCRAELGWGDEEVVLFYGGRHPRVKRRDLADAAMAILRTRTPSARLYNMDGSVDPAAVPVLMNAADCFLLTSDFEGSPTVVQEAKACDLPVVSVPVGDVVNQLEGVSNSRVVGRVPEELAGALQEILVRRDRSNGSQHLGSSSLDAVAHATLAVYEKVARRARRGARG